MARALKPRQAERHGPLLEEEERAGRVFIVRPQEKVQVGRIEKNREKLDALYQIGLEDGRNAMAAMKAYLEK